MKQLRFLYVDCDCVVEQYDEFRPYLPNTLRSVEWVGYPYCCLPETFQANKLVNIDMSDNNISQLWEKGKRKVE